MCDGGGGGGGRRDEVVILLVCGVQVTFINFKLTFASMTTLNDTT